MQNILVTGGAGYVGSILVRRLLNSNYRVTCIDNLRFGGDSLIDIWNHENFVFHKIDITDKAVIDKIFNNHSFFAIVHLAAIVGDPACKREPDVAKRTNWGASVYLLEKARECGVKKFVFASTCSNYGKMEDSDRFLDEHSTLAPVSLYAELKVKFETYMLKGVERRDDFHPTSLRFATVYGLSPRMRFDLTVNEFTKELSLGRELLVYGEQFWRPYCHVADFSNAILSVLQAPGDKIAYNVFNVGDTEENYTKQMLIKEITKQISNCKIKFVEKKEDPRDYRVNFDKIKNELGFRISKRLPDGIAEVKDIVQLGIIANSDDQRYYNIPH